MKLQAGDRVTVFNRTLNGQEIEEGPAELLRGGSRKRDGHELWLVRFEVDCDEAERWVNPTNRIGSR